MKSDNPTEPKKFNRRDFVKKMGLATGSGMLLSSLPVGVSAFSGGSDTLKLALVGCGGRGTGATHQALSADEGVQLVAMADAFRDRLDDSYNKLSKIYAESDRVAVKEEHKFVGFDAYKKAIDMADVVILATPPGFRPYHFEEAVNAGKHIFMEKPVATDVVGIRKVLEMSEVADRKKLNVVVGLQRHYQKNYRQVLDRVKDNAIGKITSGQVYWNSDGVWVRPRKPEQTELEYQMRNWYYFNWLCGDHILEQHIHNIDVANWFIGEYPVSAQGMGGREVRNGKDHGQIFDHHFVEFTYPSGAVIASQCRHQPGTMSRVSETLQGTEGTVQTDGRGQGTIKKYSGVVAYDHDSTNDINPYQQEHNELFASIRAGKTINNADYGAKSTMTAILGRMATYTGQVVKWDEAINSSHQLLPPTMDWDSTPPVLPKEDGTYPVPVPGKTEVFTTSEG